LPPTLAKTVELAGDSLVHVDIRSDNLCLRNSCAVIFDWNQASIGNPLFDLAEWLPSLAAEGGPPPEQLPAARRRRPFRSDSCWRSASNGETSERERVRRQPIAHLGSRPCASSSRPISC
jgi:aminoglycoside phosphotransferase (APT) family kinase protein